MSATPSYDRWAASVVANGLACCECSASFTEPHGSRTACRGCFRRLAYRALALVLPDGTAVLRAVHPEANRVANEVEGRRRKSVKQARLERAKQEQQDQPENAE